MNGPSKEKQPFNWGSMYADIVRSRERAKAKRRHTEMDIDFEKIAQTLEQYRDTYSRTLDAARNKDAETTREGLAALFDVFGAMLDVIDLEGKPKPYTGGEDGAL